MTSFFHVEKTLALHQARSKGKGRGAVAPPEIFGFEQNSAKKVEFCLLKWTIIVRLCAFVLQCNLELCKETKSYFCSAKNNQALKCLLIFHQNRQKQNELGLLEFIAVLRGPPSKIYYCTRVKLFRVHTESFTMASKEPPKKKSTRDNGLFCVYSECTCVDVTYFVPV